MLLIEKDVPQLQFIVYVALRVDELHPEVDPDDDLRKRRPFSQLSHDSSLAPSEPPRMSSVTRFRLDLGIKRT
jgi:hypothetical protein